MASTHKMSNCTADYLQECIDDGAVKAVQGWAKIDDAIEERGARKFHNGDSSVICVSDAVRVTAPQWSKVFPYIHKSMFCALLNSGIINLPAHKVVDVETIKNKGCIAWIDSQLVKLGYNPNLSRACRAGNNQHTNVAMSVETAEDIVASLLERDGKGFYHCDSTIGVAINVLRTAHAPKSMRPVLKSSNFTTYANENKKTTASYSARRIGAKRSQEMADLYDDEVGTPDECADAPTDETGRKTRETTPKDCVSTSVSRE